jgi:flagellar protein FlaG
MDMSEISTNTMARVSAATEPAEVIPADQAAENREIVRAVKALNGTEMFGDENELTFQRDSVSHRMVVRVVNRNTREVISQIPPEYVLQLAQDLPNGKE